MKDFKNTIILFLSLVVFVQALFLIYLIRRPSDRPSTARRPAPSAPVAPTRPKAAPAAVSPQAVPSASRVPRAPETLPTQVAGRIVLVLDDWGYNLKHRDFITDNDFKVTLSVLPFTPYAEAVAELAAVHGKDVLIHMPMEPQHKESYGLEPNTLMVGMSRQQIINSLEAAYRSVPNAKGISNHMGSRATEDPALMNVVFQFLRARAIFFFDSAVTSSSLGREMARKYGVGFSERQIFVDNEDDAAYIRRQLVSLAQRAKASGVAVGIGHDRPTTIAVLEEMIPLLRRQGFVFVNLSEAIADRPSAGES